jgi:predicted polyphosphate/ATP-dependent NAD kinase
MSSPLVGIIANPASGRDIRRLVAQGTVFDNNEKTAIVRRALLGLEAVGIRRVAYMPEHDFGILPRALTELQSHHLQISAEPLEMPVLGTSADSTRAAQLLREQGSGCIITLGGDGTNRAVAAGCGSVPLVPISTGTNNVFPTFLEGTIAGMAAGLVASGMRDQGTIQQARRLEVWIDGMAVESALVDVVVTTQSFIGSRAIWDMSVVREVVLSRAAAATIGMSALGGALLYSSNGQSGRTDTGMHIELGESEGEAAFQVLAPLAPGLVNWVSVRKHTMLAIGDIVRFQQGVGTVALDGEREIELAATTQVEVRLCADGPFVVDVPAVLEAAAHAQLLHRRSESR